MSGKQLPSKMSQAVVPHCECSVHGAHSWVSSSHTGVLPVHSCATSFVHSTHLPETSSQAGVAASTSAQVLSCGSEVHQPH
ncbi:hypothetical protein SAMN02745121_00737 [Nannocystis exedens]|uniref:Uncharacterized protein n=1 Tax=Nannocystis exedens TaxID=54 RepID=A0A1I1TIG8_9BACT|nr:hypothetical protein [Nannocystis exedens]SFD58431.1 hypothetical protein SAMN02745121_00737 [Nannocystis exedens]